MQKCFVQNTLTPNKHPNKTSLRVKACSVKPYMCTLYLVSFIMTGIPFIPLKKNIFKNLKAA